MKTTDKKSDSSESPFHGNVAIVAAQWHRNIVDRLVEGAQTSFRKAGVPASAIHLHWVGGSFELPQAVSKLARSGHYAAIVPIGCIIRGETAHFEYIAQAVFLGLDAVGRETGVPVSLAVLTVDNVAQALARAGGDQGNKAEEAAEAAMGLARLFDEVENGKPVPGA